MPPKKKGAVVEDTGPKCTIKETDMSPEMQKQVIKAVKDAMKKSKLEKDICLNVKKAFDDLYPQTTWHCIAGSHFGVSVTHATDNLVFLSVEGGMNIVLFKSME